MTTPHKATPLQWSRVQGWADDGGSSTDSCILELRDRLAAIEQQIQAVDATTEDCSVVGAPDHLRGAPEMVAYDDSSPAPAGGLVERVAASILRVEEDDPEDDDPGFKYTSAAIRAGCGLVDLQSQAAIQAVAQWFDAIGYGATASILRQEVQHG